MARLVQLLAVLAVGYLMWTYAMPRVRSLIGQSQAPVSDPAPGPGGHSVQIAAEPSRSLEGQ